MTDKQYSRRAARGARRDARRAKRQERWNNFTSWWQDNVADNFRSETRDSSEGMGKFLNGVDNLWNRITGSGLTDSQREANQYSAAMAEQQYNREVEFYEKYQSPKAMMQQGVNPFGISGSAGGHSASGGSPQSVSPAPAEGLGGMLGLVQSIFGMVQQKRSTDSQIALNKSAEDRNYSEANERNINAASLADMNAAEIMQKLSNVEINSANVKLIASKVLNTEEDTKLKTNQINKLVFEVLNLQADTSVKEHQLGLIFSEIMRNSKSVDLMNAQIEEIGSILNVNEAQVDLLKEELNGLIEEHGHQFVMNALSEITASRDSGEENGYYRALSEVKRFLTSIFGWWSGTTSIDLPHKKPARIGFK